MILRVVIIDDDPDARDELHYLLKTYHPDFDVVASVDYPVLALQQIEAGVVDVVFLDINFEEKGRQLGLNFAKLISRLPLAPFIIFITAYPNPENMLEAFSCRPYGFITKPIEITSLEAALDRIQKELAKFSENVSETTTPVNNIEIRYHLFKAQPDGDAIEKVFINRFLAPNEIKYIQSNQGVDVVKIYLVNGDVLDHVTLRLNKWLNFNLPCFVQISRNTVVHLKYAGGFRADKTRFDAHLLLFKDCSTELPIGPKYFLPLRDALKAISCSCE